MEIKEEIMPHCLAPLRGLALIYLGVSLLLRLVLWSRFGINEGVDIVQLPLVLGAGLVNDLAELVYLLAPLTFYLLLLPRRFGRHPLHRFVFQAGMYLTIFGMLYLAAAEYFFFDEFQSRFNLVAVDYLIYPHEVLVNIWETYPVGWFLTAAVLMASLLFSLLRQNFVQPLLAPVPQRQCRWLILGHILALTLCGCFFSTDTIAVSNNRVENEMVANGISSFFRAFRTNELDYDKFYRTMSPDAALTVLRNQLSHGNSGMNWQGDSINRTFVADPAGLGKMNVVVIVEESFGAQFVGAYGDGRGLTPDFDRLASKGLLFRNTYATGTRTVRGLEAITCSFPPIPSESIVKRPGCENVATWGQVMAANGYRTSFLYGGFSYFDNMNHFFSHNGFEIVDRADIVDPVFENIWGVSDGDLFNHALGYFDQIAQTGTPFFTVIMSTSNHSPYTFPPGIAGVPGEGGGREAGIRYADHALGRFFDAAPAHAWFANTLFVVVADHDARVYGRAQIPMQHYRIPLLVYAPGKVEAGIVELPTSQIDIAPTVLALLGLPYTAPFYGENVMAAGGVEHPILLNHNHDVGLYRAGKLVVLGLNNELGFFNYDPEKDLLAPAETDRDLADLAIAYYQTAFQLFREHRYQ